MLEVSPGEFAGRRLLQVTTSWHRYGDDAPGLVHFWLHLAGMPPVRCHTAGNGALEWAFGAPYGPYEMDELGRVTVGPAPADFPLTRFCGRTVTAVQPVLAPASVQPVGVILHFNAEQVRIMNVADEFEITG